MGVNLLRRFGLERDWVGRCSEGEGVWFAYTDVSMITGGGTYQELSRLRLATTTTHHCSSSASLNTLKL